MPHLLPRHTCSPSPGIFIIAKCVFWSRLQACWDEVSQLIYEVLHQVINPILLSLMSASYEISRRIFLFMVIARLHPIVFKTENNTAIDSLCIFILGLFPWVYNQLSRSFSSLFQATTPRYNSPNATSTTRPHRRAERGIETPLDGVFLYGRKKSLKRRISSGHKEQKGY